MKKFAVIWTKDSMPIYGISKENTCITVVPQEPIKVNVSKSNTGRPKIRYTEPLAIFDERNEAEAYRNGNNDWLTVECTLTFNTK